MNLKLLLYGLGVWCVLLVLAILNAGLREKVYARRMKELSAHQLGSGVFIAVIFIVTWAFLGLTGATYTMADLVELGVLWLLLTIVFEFLFGRFVMGHPWSRLLTDYNLLKGRVWTLVLLSNLFLPPLVGWLIMR